MTITEILNEDFLIETVIKTSGGYKIKREDGKLMPKIYKSLKGAIRVILGMKSKGGFYNLSKEEQSKRINNYIKKHNLKK
jgi:hypothetical protein